MKVDSCVLFSPPNPVATLQMCRNICDDEVAKQVGEGNTASVSCISFTPEGEPDRSEIGMGTYMRR